MVDAPVRPSRLADSILRTGLGATSGNIQVHLSHHSSHNDSRSITELRDAIFAHLLPNEVATFCEGCELCTGIEAIAAALSPLRIILSGDRLPEPTIRDGFNLTIISGTKDEPLYGLFTGS